jgi:hypothetical protein
MCLTPVVNAMIDPFHNSRYSVEHAKRRIRELESEITAYSNTNPYTKVVELEKNGSEEVHKIKLVNPMPVALPGIAFDAVNNLRSALDQAGFAVACAAGKNGKNGHFPFGDNLSEVQSRIRGHSKDIPIEIFDLMVSFKPYKGGNDLLWALNKLCNTNKHEIIIPIATASAGFLGKNVTWRPSGGTLTIPPLIWDSVENEMEYARITDGGKYEGEFQFSFFIAIGKIEIVEGNPAIDVINAIAGEVERILLVLEAEARRIGLFK